MFTKLRNMWSRNAPGIGGGAYNYIQTGYTPIEIKAVAVKISNTYIQ